LNISKSKSAAHPSDGAAFFWDTLPLSIFVISSWTGELHIAVITLFFALLLDPKISFSKSNRVFLLVSLFCLPIIGPLFGALWLCLWGVFRKTAYLGILCSVMFLLWWYWSPWLNTLLPYNQTIPFQSLWGVIGPGFLVALLCLTGRDYVSGLKVILSTLFMLFVCYLLSYGGWVTYEIVTIPYSQAVFSLFPIFFVSTIKSWGNNPKVEWGKHKVEIHLVVLFIIVGVLLGLLSVFLIKPITIIAFDESHGAWESITTEFEPDSYGRHYYYNYKRLADYAGMLGNQVTVFSDENDSLEKIDLFILKMPTKPLSEEFIDKTIKWVKSGGVLWVIGDHTDLYDTTQHLTPTLARLGLAIGKNAVFNREGRPNKVTTSYSEQPLGRILSNNVTFEYQTGASIIKFPWYSQILGDYGLGFVESGDYSRPNRFGYFEPKLNKPYYRPVSQLMIPSGKGAIVLLADSTPWSNFSIFKTPYRQWFRQLISASEKHCILNLLPYIWLLLFIVYVLLIVKFNRVLFITSNFILGFVIGLGVSSVPPPWEGSYLSSSTVARVISGKDVKFEFLDALLPIGRRNYSRAMASLEKRDVIVNAIPPGQGAVDGGKASMHILIEPDMNQLPDVKEVVHLLNQKQLLLVLFSPEQINMPYVRDWIDDLGLHVVSHRAKGFSEDPVQGLLNRNGIFQYGWKSYSTHAEPSSNLLQLQHSAIAQRYTIRPLPDDPNIPIGNLVVSFHADQFSDTAMGDVWDGVNPTSLSRLRESQLASMLLNEEWQYNNLSLYTPIIEYETPLENYFIVENNIKILEGELSESVNKEGLNSIGINPDGYLSALQQQAIAWIAINCALSDHLTSCPDTMIGHDLVEWRVHVLRENGDYKFIELIHEKRFSGIGSTYHVVFGSN